MTTSARRHVLIIGGGASGVLLARHLLDLKDADVRVTLIERAARIGRGMAYGTTDPQHLLNVGAAGMSAFAHKPDDFWRWLDRRGDGADYLGRGPHAFVPRVLYGEYLESLLAPWLTAEGAPNRLHIERGECVAIRETCAGVTVSLSDGANHVGHAAVIATGHDINMDRIAENCVSPWAPNAFQGDEPVFALGTGLTMVDYVLGLLDRGHRGKIIALSRRGQTPQPHRRNTAMRIDSADVPLGTSMSYFFRWVRETTRWAEERGGDWREAVDGLRPYIQTAWQSWPPETKQRFLSHVQPWWDAHRHRMPASAALRIRNAAQSGQLTIIAGKIAAISRADSGAEVRFRRRGTETIETVRAAAVVDCTGVISDPGLSRNPLLQSLVNGGQARPDPFGIGLDVTRDCALVDRWGRPSSRIFAVGPVTRAAFWEINSIPEIRVQAAQLAARIGCKAPAVVEA